MYRSSLIIVLLVINNIAIGQGQWHLSKDKNKIKVYTRTIQNSKYKECKTTTIINAPTEIVFQLIRDVPHSSQWIDKVTSAREIKTRRDYYISYEIIHLGHGIKDRDIVTKNIIKRFDDGKIKIIITSAASTYPPQNNKVRIKKVHGYWLLEPIGHDKTKLTYQFFSDPQNVPGWIINTFISESPYKTVLNLKRLAERK